MIFRHYLQTDDEEKTIGAKSQNIPYTNTRWRKISQLKTILSYQTKKKIYLLHDVLSLEIMTIFAAEKII